MVSGRALHFVFKVADRALTAKFYREILGMKMGHGPGEAMNTSAGNHGYRGHCRRCYVGLWNLFTLRLKDPGSKEADWKVLRHEEFSEGCEAACNGPYANRWSKTMIGYGPEDTHFVVELTYNYGITHYERGNDFLGLTLVSRESLQRAAAAAWPVLEEAGRKYLEAPGGYRFYVVDSPQPTDKDPVQKVSLASSNLSKSIAYWNGVLNMKIYEQNEKKAVLGFGDNQAKLELVDIGTAVNHAKAYGRIAFSCPREEQPLIEKKVQGAGGTILTPLISLDTPGKATVRVLILADPDAHEICFVDDESFRELSQPDADGDAALTKYIKADKSR